jgi:hypothetical protein
MVCGSCTEQVVRCTKSKILAVSLPSARVGAAAFDAVIVCIPYACLKHAYMILNSACFGEAPLYLRCAAWVLMYVRGFYGDLVLVMTGRYLGCEMNHEPEQLFDHARRSNSVELAALKSVGETLVHSLHRMST